MLDTISQPPNEEPLCIAPSDEPTATYDSGNHTILAKVIVTHVAGEARPRFHAPLIAIPGPDSEGESVDWIVNWILVKGTGVTSAFFHNDPNDATNRGITIPSKDRPLLPPPNGINVLESSQGDDNSQWRVKFNNSVRSAQFFAYDLVVDVTLTENELTENEEMMTFRHDPTIAVTSDPIEG